MLFITVKNYMNENKLSRTQLAKRLGVSKGYVSQILNGDFNHKLSKLVDLSLAIGKIPELKLRDLQTILDNEAKGFRTTTWDVTINDNYINGADEINNFEDCQSSKSYSTNTEVSAIN